MDAKYSYLKSKEKDKLKFITKLTIFQNLKITKICFSNISMPDLAL
jgi:hypothetical protein